MDPTILTVVAVYFVITLGLGFWVARNERNVADDYFLAGRKLPWYAVSLSMTGSNIGTEHFMGMVGTAYAFGLAPAAGGRTVAEPRAAEPDVLVAGDGDGLDQPVYYLSLTWLSIVLRFAQHFSRVK